MTEEKKSQYKLIYFDLTGAGEPIRWIFKLAKVPFEDERIAMKDWRARKATFPLGTVPILYEDGVGLTQTNSIVRYLCAKFGFVTPNRLLQYRSDQVMDILVDTKLADRISRPFFSGMDEEKRKMYRDEFLACLPQTFDQLTGILEETSGKFIAGDCLTCGDFVLATWLHIILVWVDPHLLDDRPQLKAHMDAVTSVPEIRDWIAVRPKTLF